MLRNRAVWRFLAAAVAGLLASLFTLHMGEALSALNRPFLFPPFWMLPVGWTAALIAAAGAMRYAVGLIHKKTVAAFYVSLGLVVVWAFVFFRLGMRGTGFVAGFFLTGIWLRNRRLLREFSQDAAKWMTCATAWAGYATYLNLGVWFLNRG